MKKVLLALMFFFSFSQAFAANLEIVNMGVSEESEQDIVVASKEAARWMKENFNHSLRHDVRLYLVPSANDLPEMFLGGGIDLNRISARSKRGVIGVIDDGTKTTYYLAFLAIHELIHQYQMSAIGGTATLEKNMWLTEGMADVLAVYILDNEEMRLRFLANARRFRGEDLSLRSITQRSGWVKAYNAGLHPYAKADLAVHYLMANYSPYDLFALMNLMAINDIDEAMNKVYGITVEDLESLAGTKIDTDELLDAVS